MSVGGLTTFERNLRALHDSPAYQMADEERRMEMDLRLLRSRYGIGSCAGFGPVRSLEAEARGAGTGQWRRRIVAVIVAVGLLLAMAASAWAEPTMEAAEAREARIERELRWYRVVLLLAIIAHGMDLSTTMYCLGAGLCHELNPVLRPMERRPVLFGGMKMGMAGAGLLGVDALRRRGHRKLAFWLTVAQTAVVAGAVVHNVRVMNRAKPP